MAKTSGTATQAKKSGKALRAAMQKRRQQVDWVTFYREVLGVDGIVRRIYSDPREHFEFEHSEEYGKILGLLRELRDEAGQPAEDKEPEKVITVRLPKSIHQALLQEASEFGTSMNRLCIAKLIQALDEEIAPRRSSDEEKPRP